MPIENVEPQKVKKFTARSDSSGTPFIEFQDVSAEGLRELEIRTVCEEMEVLDQMKELSNES